jgi:3-oxoacyl-[acyl-carrier protein] reductase
MLKGRIAVVVAGSDGVGAAMARYLGEQGASVVLTYAEDGDGAERVASEIQHSGGDALAFHSEMSDERDYSQVIQFAETHFGHVDLFFNNARDYPDDRDGKKTEEYYLSEFRSMMTEMPSLPS